MIATGDGGSGSGGSLRALMSALRKTVTEASLAAGDAASKLPPVPTTVSAASAGSAGSGSGSSTASVSAAAGEH